MLKKEIGMFAGNGMENVTYGTGGGAEILGMEKPIRSWSRETKKNLRNYPC